MTDILKERDERGHHIVPYPTSLKRGSNSTAYLLARLERDRPDLASRVQSGELTVRTAALEAGIARDSTPLDDLRLAWKKATTRERATFRSETA